MNRYYFYILFTALLSAISQILLNVSAKKTYDKKYQEYLNPWVISSYMILGFTLLANIYIMRMIPLKTAHVLAATTYIFVAILSKIFLKEKMSVWNFVGITLIFFGVVIFIL